MNYREIVEELPIKELISNDKSPFWYTEKDFDTRYKHEEGGEGDIFYDGNNGDQWIVLAMNTNYNRGVVKNRTQGGIMLFYWK